MTIFFVGIFVVFNIQINDKENLYSAQKDCLAKKIHTSNAPVWIKKENEDNDNLK